MGWSGGTELFSAVIKVIKPAVKDEKKRTQMYRELIEAFTDCDWDTVDECCGEDTAYDAAYEQWRIDNGLED